MLLYGENQSIICNFMHQMLEFVTLIASLLALHAPLVRLTLGCSLCMVKIKVIDCHFMYQIEFVALITKIAALPALHAPMMTKI